MRKFETNMDSETLSPPQRVAEVVFAVCMLLLAGFLVRHQTMNTGFFTAGFGTLEMICLYVPLLLGIIPLVVRAWTGQRNLARPFEAASSLLLGIGSLWLVVVFPLNYVHLADALPNALRFMLAWVTDGIGRAVLILQVIIGPVSALLTILKYRSMRQAELESWLKRQVQ